MTTIPGARTLDQKIDHANAVLAAHRQEIEATPGVYRVAVNCNAVDAWLRVDSNPDAVVPAEIDGVQVIVHRHMPVFAYTPNYLELHALRPRAQ